MLHLLPWVFLLPMPPLQLEDVPESSAASTVVVEEPVAEQECPKGYMCIAEEDAETLRQLLRDHKCRADTAPEVMADQVVIVQYHEGRVYGSGTGEFPFKIKLTWCNYEVEASSNVKLQVAQHVDPEWGFRLRLKATGGLLVVDAFTEDALHEALDGGLLLDAFFIQWFNLNAYIGFRSFGGGLGADLTKNFGVYGGYALTWGSWRSNPFVGVSFAF
jgi:hypothetical protein